MAARIPWDEYEAAFLLQQLIRVLDHDVSRKDAIRLVSDTLRKRAVRQGREVDEIF